MELNSQQEDGLKHITVLEASASLSFPPPPPPPTPPQLLPKSEDDYLFAEAPPASAVYSHLRLQLPDSLDLPLAEDPSWPEGTPIDEESDVSLPLNTSFLIPRVSTLPQSQAAPLPSVMEALQVNTLSSWTSELSTLGVWRRSILDIQRDWMSSFNDLASLAQARFQEPSMPWWPYHLLAVNMMAQAADELIDNSRTDSRESTSHDGA